ncbi:MAG: molybdopterin-guanine dinucleotide biosynthesis protein B [Gammaproteobacteria bacterium]|nr:molybdopterin-guanine dinucleotide biosynthesis protein B [Gammaproteobacteria bacterium]MCW8909186.1 molybdopterin-guanine dinucleotide biosynthesis protein B [Gammaproteobacteria bacterium]MCW9004382.1 molybdopterin-guanine dinucleotide biosynthesis protein B [Gammaproteobacteria bacterium]MCW9056679.1 molybdopterin-guanine dinucleotide biosynthesis protein B [Gammaproteobacteria bacterium]
MNISYPKPVIGFAAYSGTGKTTLLTQLIPVLKQKGLRVAVIKHAHHDFDIDQPGKDSYELRKAGASPMLISSSQRIALMIDKEEEKEPELDELINYINPDTVDIILVEGFKHWPMPKIELHRPATGKALIFPDDANIIAIAHDDDIEHEINIPRLDINNPVEIAEFLIKFIKQ